MANRYRIFDGSKGKDIDSVRAQGGPRWLILDTQTGLFVDDAFTQYEARQAASNWNAGLYSA